MTETILASLAAMFSTHRWLAAVFLVAMIALNFISPAFAGFGVPAAFIVGYSLAVCDCTKVVR